MKRPEKSSIAKMSLVAAGVAGLWLAWKLLPLESWSHSLVQRVESLGPWGAVVYLVLFATLGALSVPLTPLYIASGVLFDFTTGFVVGFAGGITAATLSFLFARYVGRESWEAKLRSLPRFEALVDALEAESFKVMLLARLNPFLPSSLKNFGFGLTGVRLHTFAITTALGQLPFALTYVYLGWLGGVAALSGEGLPPRVRTVFLVVGGAVSVVSLALLSWFGGRYLRSRAGPPREPGQPRSQRL